MCDQVDERAHASTPRDNTARPSTLAPTEAPVARLAAPFFCFLWCELDALGAGAYPLGETSKRVACEMFPHASGTPEGASSRTTERPTTEKFPVRRTTID
jgi:hypothetical protein